MSFNRAHTSIKAADVVKKVPTEQTPGNTHSPTWNMAVVPSNSNPNTTLT